MCVRIFGASFQCVADGSCGCLLLWQHSTNPRTRKNQPEATHAPRIEARARGMPRTTTLH